MNAEREYMMIVFFILLCALGICAIGIFGSLCLSQLAFDECKADGKSDLYCMKVAY